MQNLVRNLLSICIQIPVFGYSKWKKERQSIVAETTMNIRYKSRNWKERILSNLAETPFSIEINGETFHCSSVEGFWQGLKYSGPMRDEVFQMSGFKAKKAGKNRGAPTFEIAGKTFIVGSRAHENLIREAIRQKILQNPRAGQALKYSRGEITHDVRGAGGSIFRMEKLLMSIRKELWGY